MISLVAYYLPQFHPTIENSKWWGEGFTEWTNVASARPLFKGHYQPKVPKDLGFYDLRYDEVKFSQVNLAKEAGISAFCYWHYWFGDGKTILSKPIRSVLENKNIDFPFSLGWANHDWQRKDWDKNSSVIIKDTLIKQKYLGVEDYIAHFNYILPLLKDKRYFQFNGKNLFTIFKPDDVPDFKLFKSTFNSLAKINNLPDFYFVAISNNKFRIQNYIDLGYDCVNLTLLLDAFNVNYTFLNKTKMLIKNGILKLKNVHLYKDAIKKFSVDENKLEEVAPTVIPNWDHTPRSGRFGQILHNSTPEYFEKHLNDILEVTKNKNNKLVFLKSWNEWGEGNYLEPDLKYGKRFIEVCGKLINKFNNK